MSLKKAPCKTLPESRKQLFHSKYGYGEAKKFCMSQCSAEMRQECLELALSFEVSGERRYGVFGGKSANEREQEFGSGAVA